MTTSELQKILQSNKPLTVSNIGNILYQLKCDIIREQLNLDPNDPKYSWYNGEMNGFQIALDLLEHAVGGNNE